MIVEVQNRAGKVLATGNYEGDLFIGSHFELPDGRFVEVVDIQDGSQPEIDKVFVVA